MSNLHYINLVRSVSTKYGTFGTLSLDGINLSTLEPTNPIIPKGDYLVECTYSPKFSMKPPYNKYVGVPLIKGVPGHEGIRIHIGNYRSDTNGCILVGTSHDDTLLLNSKKAYCDLMLRMSQIHFYNHNAFFVLHVQ